jgi:two-component system phosphate regulon sensor histidine kinase PhoR
MDMNGNQLLIGLVILELLQLLLFWAFIRRRYLVSLRKLNQITEQLATGQWPRSYFIDGPAWAEQFSRRLEKIGTSMENLTRRQQEEDFNLNMLLANMVEGVLVVDQRHVVRLVNAELLNLFDLQQSPIGRTVLESLREARIEMVIRETIQTGERRRQEVILESAKMGQPAHHFDLSAVPIRTKTGGIGGAVVVLHDITRLKQLEVVRREFVANVSHELRTPLSIFRGYLETLLDNPGLPPEDSKKMLDAMRRHSNRLNALVEDLLVLTRLEAGQVEGERSAIRVDAFFRQLVGDWEKRAGAEPVAFELQMPPDLPPLEVDTLRFEQVIFNLLENAAAYSNPPRRIVISAKVVEKQMEIRVADNGIGIPPGDVPNIFGRFYRVDKDRARVSGGTGLGLSIVKHIIQTHNGTVHAESELGKGTTIVIRLPLHAEG